MILETEDLVKEFDSVRAIDHLDFSLAEQEIRAIIGPNGAGKTTFFDLITGRIQPTSGHVHLHSDEITDWPPHRIAKSIGRKFQITNIYEDFTVMENLEIADQAAENSIANSLHHHELSEEVYDILDLIGLQSKQADIASTLAYGERQWLEIGMLLLNDPELLLLDEPTSGMTMEETQKTAQLVRELGDEKPILIVEHDLEFIYDIADTITVLHQGQKLAEGSPEYIRDHETVQRVYVGGEV